jgi:glutathione S-transferase
MTLTIYGDPISGNCLKVRWVADRLGLSHRWIDVDVMKGEAKTPAMLEINPAGQVPCVILPDGRSLAQSNAILWHLAEGSDLIPADAYDRARMLEWMFWEQYSH